MATVRFFVDEQDLLPEVCIKSGAPTSDRLSTSASYRPAWPFLLLPFSILAVIVGLVAGARHRPVRLPMAGQAVRRAQSWWRWSLALAVAGCCGLVLSAILGEVAAARLTLALVLVAMVVNVVTRIAFWPGVSIDKEGQIVTVTRCSRRFVDAMKELSQV